MPVIKKQLKELTQDLTTEAQEKDSLSLQPLHSSLNETPVDLLDPVLIRWIKIIKPSRASLTYERFE